MSNSINSMIDGAIRRQPEQRPNASGNSVGADVAKPNQAETTDLLNLTGRAKELHSLQQDLAKSPEFDEARVNELKQAISDGSYKVDAQRVADKMLDIESRLP